MLNELIKNKEKYFWSKSEDGKIIVGGYNNSRFYGQITISLTKEELIIRLEVSNGVTSSITLADRKYSNLTEEFKQFEILSKGIDDYLNSKETKLNQEMNRETLLQNVLNLLPKYRDVE